MNPLPFFLVQLSKAQKRRARKKRQNERTQAEMDRDETLYELTEKFHLIEVRLDGRRVAAVSSLTVSFNFSEWKWLKQR